MKKVLKWIAITLAVVVLLPLLLLVAVNLFDEDLDPNAAKYGEPRAASVPDAENAYVALIALNASDGSDSTAYARAWLGEVKAAALEKRKEKLPESTRAKRPALCEPRDALCLARWREKSGEMAQQLEAYKEDLARYDTLLGYRRYEEILDYLPRPDSTMAPYQLVAIAQRAYLLRAGMDVEAGRLEEVVTALEKDLAFQRMVLGSSRTLIGKMVATANYWRDMQFVSELMQTRAAEITPFLPRLRKALGGLDVGKMNLGSVMETEFQLPKVAFRDLREGLVSQGMIAGVVEGGSVSDKMWDVVGLFFFKRNASLNRSYRYYSGMGAVMDAPADKSEEQLRAFTAGQPASGPQWNWIYNPVGKILVDVAAPLFQEYAWRVHDLDALSRMLALRMDMLAEGVSAEQAAEFITKSDASLHNPYTRKPVSWDADKKRLYFEPKSASAKRYKQGVDNGKVFIAL